MKNKKSVLIIAYACEPNKTSEPGVGWNFTKEIAKSCETIVLTRGNNKKNIEGMPKDNRIFVYYDLPKIFKIMKKKLPLGTQLYYFIWQIFAYRYIKKEITISSIDIVHHLTFGISWISPPSFFLNRKFVWGPIGGGDFIPLIFLKQMGFKNIIKESLYYFLNTVGKYTITSHLVRRKVNAITFRTQSAKKNFPQTDTNILPIISETALDNLEKTQQKKQYNSYVYALCIGRMTYWKGFFSAVKGFHTFLKMGGKGKLELLGNGPELEKINQYIQENNLEKYIITCGLVKSNIVEEKLQQANILIHPSFRDGGSWAIMEAMSCGLPVICLNTSGPKDMVTEKCGLLIDMVSPNQVIEDIGKGLFELSNNSEMFNKLSTNAQKRIQSEYSWQVRGKQIQKVYEEVIGEGK